jgi:hypothetical protein
VKPSVVSKLADPNSRDQNHTTDRALPESRNVTELHAVLDHPEESHPKCRPCNATFASSESGSTDQNGT